MQTKPGNKNASLDLRFKSLVWTAEYNVKTLVWTKIFLSVSMQGSGGFRKHVCVDATP